MNKVQKRKSSTSVALRVIPVLIAVFTVSILFFARDYLAMRYHYDFSSVAQVASGTDGSVILVDQGKSVIEILDERNRLQKRLKGEDEDRFYYAELVLKDGENLYIADTEYDEEDQSKVKKRLLSLKGSEQKILFEQEYDLSKGAAGSENEILEFQVWEGGIYFLLKVDYGLELYRIEEGDSEPALLERYYCGDELNDASIDLGSGEVAIAVKRGYIRIFDPMKNTWVTMPTEREHLMPNRVVIRDHRVYFADLYENQVCVYDRVAQVQAPGEKAQEAEDLSGGVISELLQVEGKPVSLEVSSDGKAVLVGSSNGFYTVTEQGIRHIEGANYRYFYVTVILWVVFGLAVFGLLWTAARIFVLLKSVWQNENAIRVSIVVLAVAVVSCFVAYSLMDELFGKEEDTLIDNMKLFADLMAQQTDAEAILRMEGETFYGTSAYKTLRQPLDGMIESAAVEGKYYRYTIYTMVDNEIRYCLNYNDDVMCWERFDLAGDSYYRQVFETGNSYALSTRDAEGTWISLLTPIETKEGEVAALLEVRMDMGLRNRDKNTAIRNTIFNVFCTTAVVLMLILEGVLLLSFLEKKRKLTTDEQLDLTNLIPLRGLIFFTNAADSIQDAFVAILCAELYRGQLPIPDSVAIALPLSAQLLMLALFSSFMGSAGEKHGPAKVMGYGFLVQGAGCLCCVLTGSYFGVLAGKMMIGAGMGTVYVNCYAVAAKGKTEDSSAKAFTAISAGSLSGVTIGAGLSSVFLTIGGWRLVYLVGAILLAAAFLVTLSAKKAEARVKALEDSEKRAKAAVLQSKDMAGGGEGSPVVSKEKGKRGKAESGIGAFLWNAPIMGYFLLILLPFMMSLAYREYFLPLAAGENNVSEVSISRFYLLCGLVFLYVGPVVTNFLMKRLGTLRSVYLASSLMAAAMLLYVIRPDIGTVFFGMVVLSFVTSFSYGCMYTFFGSLPQVVKYGEAKSMEVYTVFESIGSTAGPLAYGVLLSFGDRLGLTIFGGIMLGFTAVYAMIMKGNGKKSLQEQQA